jgi:hypothetical protein
VTVTISHRVSIPNMEPRTPLRRISRGSLSALSRSASHSHSHPSTLGIPDVAFNDLTDEIEQLLVNVEGLKELDQTLREFNEGFSSFLWSMRMNAFLTEWHQVCLMIVHVDNDKAIDRFPLMILSNSLLSAEQQQKN